MISKRTIKKKIFTMFLIISFVLSLNFSICFSNAIIIEKKENSKITDLEDKTDYIHKNNITIYVDDNNIVGPWYGTVEYPFKTIKDALNISSSETTIYVFNGKYNEILYINRSINLVGENKNNTIIDGMGKESIIYISADNVTISGFTIQYTGNTFWVDAGIYIISNNNEIYDNIFTNIIDKGIFIEQSSYNRIFKNHFNYF